MSTDHNSSLPPFDMHPFEMGSQSVEINALPGTGGDSTDGPSSREREADSAGSTTMPGPDVGAIEFRVIRPGVPVRRLRLTGSRYTFGSAEGCSIRLNDPTLRPMHAVLIRDANRVLVRAYSVPLEINGNRLTETSLQIGDVLRMGAYRFELLCGIDPSAKLASAVPSQDYPMGSQTGSQQGSFDPNDPTEQKAWHSRLQREASQWRLRQSEVDLRENRCIERETELRAREAEMWSRADQLHRRETQLMSQETAALQIQEEYLARKEELARLREESRVQRRLLDERQDQIQNMESEYQQQVDNATRQLALSQQQAESATEAVQRMREQFSSLNEQLERLTHQQSALELSDQSHIDQHRELQRELETARDAAVDARAESEARRQGAEDRVAELLEQIEELKNDQSAKSDRESESETIASELRQQIDELEDRVRQVTEEASQLREDYEGACASIRQLELLVDQTTAERDEARSGLELESDALRQSVEQLTRDLGQANLELTELRAANETLSGDLNETRKQRDEAVEDAESRPSSEAFDALRVELDTVKSRLEQMQHDYDETLSRIDSQGTGFAAPGGLMADSVSPEIAATELEAVDDSMNEQSVSSIDDSAAAVSAGLLGDYPALSPRDSGMAGEPETSESTSAEAAVDDSTVETEASTKAEEESEVDDDSEAWPTYQAPSQDWTPAANEETVAEESVGEPISDADQFENPWQSVDASEEEQQPASDSQWRPDGQQDVESKGHLSAWDESDSEEVAESAEDPNQEAPNQEAVAQWQDESPEVAVDETLADIEQSVDQAIADLDARVNQVAEDQNVAEEGVISEDRASHDDSISYENVDDNVVSETDSQSLAAWSDTDESVAADEAAQATQEEFNPWASTSADEIAADETETEAEASVNPWDQNAQEADDDDSANGYQPIDPWSQAYDDEASDAASVDSTAQSLSEPMSDDSEPAAGSLADSLIRDIHEDAANEVPDASSEYAADEADSVEAISEEAPSHESAYSYESFSSADDDDENDSVEATFVMNSAAAEVADDDAESPWDLQLPDEVDSKVSDESVDESSPSVDATQSIDQETKTVDVSEDPAVDDDDDDSIEAYMNRLLKRVHTEPAPEEDENLASTKSVALSGNTVTMTEADEDSMTQAVEEEPIDPEAPLVPRSQAPERARNMSAMRDLANHSARSAVARSVKIQARDTQIKAIYKFFGAATGIVCGLLCIYFIEQLGLIWCAMCAGLGLVVAVMYGQEGYALLKEANARMNAAEAGETESKEAEAVSSEANSSLSESANIDTDDLGAHELPDDSPATDLK